MEALSDRCVLSCQCALTDKRSCTIQVLKREATGVSSWGNRLRGHLSAEILHALESVYLCVCLHVSFIGSGVRTVFVSVTIFAFKSRVSLVFGAPRAAHSAP